MNRRSFFKLSTSGLVAGGLPFTKTAHSATATRKFTIDLTPGAIGVKANGFELLEIAAKHGFESIQPSPQFLSSLEAPQRTEFLDAMKAKNLRWGAAGLPVDFRESEEKFAGEMKLLPDLAAALQSAGATRVGTWLKPFHGDMTYRANFDQHVTRLGEVTRVLADHGLRFGLEYVGTRTLWTSKRYSFIHTMAETKELIAAIDQPTLGFVLDSWHWFTAGESANDILTLENKDVVACDLNDAPKGIPVEAQLDNQRELPAATGVIDIAAFLQAVAKIGYDGPVRAEPFNQPLSQMDDEPAAEATSTAIRKAIGIAGLI